MTTPEIKGSFKFRLKGKDEDPRKSRQEIVTRLRKDKRNSIIEERRLGSDHCDSDSFAATTLVFNDEVDNQIDGDVDITSYVHAFNNLANGIRDDPLRVLPPALSTEIQEALTKVCGCIIKDRPYASIVTVRGAQYRSRNYPILDTNRSPCHTTRTFLESDSLSSLLTLWQNIHRFPEADEITGLILRVISFLTSSILPTSLFDDTKWITLCDLIPCAFVHPQFNNCLNAQSLLFFIHNTSNLYPNTRKYLLQANILTILVKFAYTAIELLQRPGVKSPERLASIKKSTLAIVIEKEEKAKEEEDMFFFSFTLALKSLATYFEEKDCDVSGIDMSMCLELVSNLKLLVDLTSDLSCAENILYAISSFSKSPLSTEILNEGFLLKLKLYVESDTGLTHVSNSMFVSVVEKVPNSWKTLLNVINYPTLVAKLLNSSDRTQADTITVLTHLLHEGKTQAANALSLRPCFDKLVETLLFASYQLTRPILFVIQEIITSADASFSNYLIESELVSSIHPHLTIQDNDIVDAVLSIFEMLFDRAKKLNQLEAFIQKCEDEGAFSSIKTAEDKFHNPLIAQRFDRIRKYSDLADNSDKESLVDNHFFAGCDKPNGI